MSVINYHQAFYILPNRVWRLYLGGKLLDQIEGRQSPEDTHFPEDWVGSGTRAINPGRKAFTDEGIGGARTVGRETYSMEEVYHTSPQEALGPAHVEAFGAQPQLLVKLLDSAIRLSLQAHPSVAWARKHLNANSGKTEAWWVLGSRGPDPWVLLGFQRPPEPAEWRRIMANQDTEAMMGCFDRVPVSPGDVLLVEGGVPHAIGPGLLMVEIQEPTDYVVRCEYRSGGVGLPEAAHTMGLGVDRVLDMFEYTACPLDEVKKCFGPQNPVAPDLSKNKEQTLLGRPRTSLIEVRQVTVNGALDLELDGRFSILIVLEGSGSLVADGVSLPVVQWSRVFVPAAVRSAKLGGTLSVARLLPPTP